MIIVCCCHVNIIIVMLIVLILDCSEAAVLQMKSLLPRHFSSRRVFITDARTLVGALHFEYGLYGLCQVRVKNYSFINYIFYTFCFLMSFNLTAFN